MKQIKGILATSHIDAHNEMMSLGALESMVKQANTQYIPMGAEHDPRIPPFGRIVSAELKKLDDGEYAIEGVGEIFEPGDDIPLSDDREIPIEIGPEDRLQITYDRTYKDPENKKIVDEIAAIFGSPPQEEIKKAVEPISVLTVAGFFIATSITAGFFGQMGADAYNALKKKLTELFTKKDDDVKEKLLVFRFTLVREDIKINVEVILTNPTETEIESFFNRGIYLIDKIDMKRLDPEMIIRRIVFKYEDEQLIPQFAVRKDAFPLKIKQR